MEGFDPNTSFGYEVSMRYDAEETRGDETDTVACLAELAGGRDALEFAVGTGRIALPLARAGLLTQDGQVRCFENAARHLAGDGVFVLECRVPTAPARPGHQYVEAERVAAGYVTRDIARYDPVTQRLDENHVHITAEGIRLGPISLRLAHPPEFELMALIAGLRLRHRTAGWKSEPFTAASWRHVSVYERASA